jgi:hypothetical protein
MQLRLVNARRAPPPLEPTVGDRHFLFPPAILSAPPFSRTTQPRRRSTSQSTADDRKFRGRSSYLSWRSARRADRRPIEISSNFGCRTWLSPYTFHVNPDNITTTLGIVSGYFDAVGLSASLVSAPGHAHGIGIPRDNVTWSAAFDVISTESPRHQASAHTHSRAHTLPLCRTAMASVDRGCRKNITACRVMYEPTLVDFFGISRALYGVRTVR